MYRLQTDGDMKCAVWWTNKRITYSQLLHYKPLQEFNRFMWWIQHGARWQPTFGPSQPTWATGLPIVSQLTISTIAIYYYYSAWKPILSYSFYYPAEGRRLEDRRLSRPQWLLLTEMLFVIRHLTLKLFFLLTVLSHSGKEGQLAEAKSSQEISNAFS